MDMFTFLYKDVNEHGSLVEIRQAKTEGIEVKPVPVPLFHKKILNCL